MVTGPTPTGIEPIIAYRAWKVDRETLTLRSPQQDQHEWQPGQPMTASCPHAHDPPAPAVDCVCGIYGVKETTHANIRGWHTDLWNGQGVFGRVRLYGTVHEGTTGYRAEHAEVVEIIRGWSRRYDRTMRKVADRYGVPIVEDDDVRTVARKAAQQIRVKRHLSRWLLGRASGVIRIEDSTQVTLNGLRLRNCSIELIRCSQVVLGNSVIDDSNSGRIPTRAAISLGLLAGLSTHLI